MSSATTTNGLEESEQRALSRAPSACEKRRPGDRLDLRNCTYILFSGAVRIRAESALLEIGAAPGRRNHEQAVGVITIDDPVSLDGAEAEVVRDSVVVSIPHEVVLDVQRRYPSVQSAWDGLWGRRRGQLRRQRADAS